MIYVWLASNKAKASGSSSTPRRILEEAPSNYHYFQTNIHYILREERGERREGREKSMEKWCKRHPSHKQSKGVCPCCLREKLSHLSASSSSTTTNTNASDHSSISDDDAAYLSGSDLSPVAAASLPHLPTDQQQQQIKLVDSSDVDVGRKRLLKKSRSLAFVLKEEEKLNVDKKKKGRFWSRLIGSSISRKDQEAHHQIARSKTMKEKYSVKCVPF